MQTETSAVRVEIEVSYGMEVYYISYGKHLYDAKVKQVHENGQCDLTVYNSADGKVPLGSSVVHLASYDSEGVQPHSWHKKSTVTPIGVGVAVATIGVTS